jgi:hypothetical protein
LPHNTSRKGGEMVFLLPSSKFPAKSDTNERRKNVHCSLIVLACQRTRTPTQTTPTNRRLPSRSPSRTQSLSSPRSSPP